jgi:hypothetical protein
MNNVSRRNVAAFDRLVDSLANALADRASNASGRYATGQAGFPADKINVYGLAQCTPDLTRAQCRGCLAEIIGQMPTSLSGRILGVRCNYRYEKDIDLLRHHRRHGDAHAASEFLHRCVSTFMLLLALHLH